MAINPVITWYKDENTTTNLVTERIDLGRIDADTSSDEMKLFIWNNRGNATEDASNAEDVFITARDIDGGDGTTVGSEVPSIANDWNRVKVDTLDEITFTPIGKGGNGRPNPTGKKAVGTNGSTTNIDADSAVTWSAGQILNLGNIIKPTVENGYVYKVVLAGTTGANEPTFQTTEGLRTEDNGIQYTTHKVVVQAPENTLLGMKNNVLPDGSNADTAAGNFAEITHQVEVPLSATSGIQVNVLKLEFKYV